MTAYTDDFSDFPLAVSNANWLKVLAGGDIAPVGTADTITSTLAGNYIVHAQASTYTASVANPTVLTVTVNHGFPVGETFAVSVQGDTHAPFNGYYTATSTGATTFSVPFDNTGNVINNDGTVTFGLFLTNATQRAEILCYSPTEAANNFVILWLRFDPRGVLGDLDYGYGIGLEWAAAGVRNLTIFKIDLITHAALILGTTTVTLREENDSDLSVLQWLRGVVVEEDPDTRLPQDPGVRIKAYVNEADDGLPTFEVVDRGMATTGVVQPLNRAPGTWAITFNAAGIVVDAFEGTDEWVETVEGDFGHKYRTLSEIRADVESGLSYGGITNYTAAQLNDFINKSARKEIRRVGDKAHFMKRMITTNISADADNQYLVTMPWDVDRVVEVLNEWAMPLAARDIVQTEDGRRRILVLTSTSGSTAQIIYFKAYSNMVQDTDRCLFPEQFDDVLVESTIVRVLTLENEPGLRAQHMELLQEARQELMHAMSTITRSQRPVMRVVGRHRRGGPYDYLSQHGLGWVLGY